MAKKTSKKITRRKKKFTLPLGVVAPIVGTTFKAANYATEYGFDPLVSGQRFADAMSLYYTGFSPVTGAFLPGNLKTGLAPLGIGFLAHKLIGGKLGLNRALASAGVPIFRI